MLSNRIILSALILLSFSGCTNAVRVASIEREIYTETIGTAGPFLPTITANSTYALNLAHRYIVLASQGANGQDALALGLISAATVGAGAVVYDGHLDILRTVGLASGAATAVGSYLSPGETSNALLIASERLICISEEAQVALNRYDVVDDDDPDVVDIVQAAIRGVRLNLRRSLVRQTPDYSTTFNQITASARTVAQSTTVQDDVDRITDIGQQITECTTLEL